MWLYGDATVRDNLLELPTPRLSTNTPYQILGLAPVVRQPAHIPSLQW